MNTPEQKKPRPPAEWWKKSPGERLAEGFKYDTSGGPDAPPDPVFLTGADLVLTNERAVVMAVDKILPANTLTLASSKAKTGKTTLAVALAHAVVTGRAFLDLLPVRQSPVFYWLPDDPNVERFKRSWMVYARDGGSSKDFSLCVTRRLLNEGGFDLLEKAIRERAAGLAIVDSYTTVRGTNTGDFVKAEYDALRTFSEIAVATKCAIILVHHHSKGQHEDPFDNAAGSFALNASADCLWTFERLDDSERILNVMGRDADPYSLVYRRGADGKLACVVDGSLAEVWPVLKDAAPVLGDTFSAADVGKALGVSARQGRRVVKQWVYSGAVVHYLGNYRLTPEAKAALGTAKGEAGDDLEPF